jgi:hypothetical protein
MPGMYEVYSQQRPGRPRWALGSSAILLLITVSLAAALVHHKNGQNDVPLKPFSKAPFIGRLPSTWQIIQGDTPEDARVALVEPTDGTHPGRRVFLFFRSPSFLGGVPEPGSLATRYAKQILRLYVSPNGQRKEDTVPYDTPETIAGLGATTISVQLTPPNGGPPSTCFVRVSVLPSGQAIGAAVLTQDVTDIRLLERICQELRILGFNPGGMPGGE